MTVNNILLTISLIVLFGYLSEWIFRKIGLPDILFLIILGFILGPNLLKIINPHSLGTLAPLLTTFTLLFLMFDGALYIDLKSLAQGIGSGISIGLLSFFVSSLAIGAIFFLITFDPVNSLMLGLALGGVSSAFIIPILKQVVIKKKLYSILTLESALTDVIAIVLAITMIELNVLKSISLNSILSQIASLFSIAGFVALIAGFTWIFIEREVVERDKNYIMTVAFVALVYVVSEFLGGNGAIAALVFGIVLTNSRTLVSVARRIMKPGQKESPEEKSQLGDVVSRREKLFYNEISFFLKTFFFVYIGLLLNVTNLKAVLLGMAIALTIMIIRPLTILVTRKFAKQEQQLINALFARGIAPAAIILTAVEKGVVKDPLVIDVVYFVITATIVLSSIKVFVYRKKSQAVSTKEQ